MSSQQQNVTTDTEKSPVSETFLSVRRVWWGVGILSFFVNLLMLTGPIYMLQIYDRVISSRSMSTLAALTVLMVVLYAFMGILDFLRSRLLVRIGNYVADQLEERTFQVWLKQGLLGSAAVKRKPLTDLARVKQFLTGQAPVTFFDIPWTPVYIAVIFMFHWVLGVFAVIGALLVLAIAYMADISTRNKQETAQANKSKSEGFSEHCHSNAETIISMGMAGDLADRWSQIKSGGVDGELRASDIAGSASAFSKAFRMFLQSAILGLGAALAIKGELSPGSMIAGSIILGRALSPLQMVIGHWRGYRQVKSSIKRLKLFFKSFPEDRNLVPLPTPRGHLKVDNLTAGPPGARTATLRGIRFELVPGDALCVIGPSASGKSTLARLLVGIWKPQVGNVRFDGASLDQWMPDDLGKHIGYLPQQVSLLEGTIGENIARFRRNVNLYDIVEAAQATGVHELILSLPEGYNTRVGESGIVLSIGQIQRIALARAAFGKPPLVVLDEPNSNLDAEGDEALTHAITRMREQGQTVVIITHRKSAMESANKVLILRSGSQVRFGSKEQVLNPRRSVSDRPANAAQHNQNPNPRPPVPPSPTNPYAAQNRGAA
ncbi:MAG: type I secretion system permease/ATPase [Hellea sp.]|nr:type I secretion system permease/ATPase [Hellea sp.]